jgi:RloB-like protein
VTSRSRRSRLVSREVRPLMPRSTDISYVFVATEDTYAAAQYLTELQAQGIVDRARVRVIPLPTTDGQSSLAALLERLRAKQDDPEILHLSRDQYWAVFDVDHHRVEELSTNTTLAATRGYHLAGSNPCFELWLLLHLTADVSAIEASNDNRRSPQLCEQRLHDVLQAGDPRARGYSKTDIGAGRFAVPERVKDACNRARALMPSSPEPWPSQVGTHVHLLVERLPSPPAARSV